MLNLLRLIWMNNNLISLNRIKDSSPRWYTKIELCNLKVAELFYFLFQPFLPAYLRESLSLIVLGKYEDGITILEYKIIVCKRTGTAITERNR